MIMVVEESWRRCCCCVILLGLVIRSCSIRGNFFLFAGKLLLKVLFQGFFLRTTGLHQLLHVLVDVLHLLKNHFAAIPAIVLVHELLRGIITPQDLCLLFRRQKGIIAAKRTNQGLGHVEKRNFSLKWAQRREAVLATTLGFIEDNGLKRTAHKVLVLTVRRGSKGGLDKVLPGHLVVDGLVADRGSSFRHHYSVWSMKEEQQE
mmetsp:Transcript_42290/g.62717  ORF Transcript_42290/g.62717 Transcript_42290/m.62717 type:complete len:204 (+) Transcript_42290:809-1420(+)